MSERKTTTPKASYIDLDAIYPSSSRREAVRRSGTQSQPVVLSPAEAGYLLDLLRVDGGENVPDGVNVRFLAGKLGGLVATEG